MGESGPRPQHAGWIYLLLAVGGFAGALGLAHQFGLGIAQTATALLPTLAPLYLSWAAFRSAPAPADLAEIADQLARSVRGQWEAEARVRRLNDPYPLPVRWHPAPAGLMEEWPLLRAMAEGRPSAGPGDPAAWADGPEALAGADAEITEVFTRRIPTRRLVVLGDPGAGKSTLLGRLLLALLDERAAADGSGDRVVPVLFPLASWNPAEQDLYAWMAARLATDYRGLGNPAPAAYGRVSRARALLEERLILPILDGLDEIPSPVRGAALDRLNGQLPSGQGVVLSCRTADYHHAALPEAGVPVKLAGAAGVELKPLDDEAVAAYLRRDAGGRHTPSADRWEPVVAQLGTGGPVARALRTPLMLFLARTVYNPRPGERHAALPDPAELCDSGRLPTPAAVRAHLYDAFVPAAYRPHPRHPSRWSPRQAEEALSQLARHLRDNRSGTADIAWWDIHLAASGRPLHLTAAVLNGLLTGLGSLLLVQWFIRRFPGEFLPHFGAGHGVTLVLVVMLTSVLTVGAAASVPVSGPARRLWDTRHLVLGGLLGGTVAAWAGPVHGVVSGVICGLATGLGMGRPSTEPAAETRWSWNLGGVVVGIVCGLAGTVVLGLSSGLALGVLGGLAFGVSSGWRAGSADLATAVGPASLLRRDARISRRLMFVVGGSGIVVGAVLGGLLAAAAPERPMETSTAILLGAGFGATIGLTVGLTSAWSHAAWGFFTLSRAELALRRRLPYALMTFLEDAHERRGVLRQVGSVYQFRHIDLQHRLATRD